MALIGLKMVEEFSPDLIICDIMMPEVDGYKVLESLKQKDTTKTIPFIFTTVKSERIDVRQGMSFGADDYLTKPFTAKELVDTVKSRLKKHETIDKHYKTKAEKITKERLCHLLSTSPAIIYSYNYPDLNNITYISDNITDILGFTPDECIEHRHFIEKHIHLDDRDIVLSKINSLEESAFLREEYRFLKKDGTYLWIYDEQKLVQNKEGNRLEVIGSWLDISERKKTETHLIRLATAIDQAAEAIIITDTESIIQYINPAFTEMTGYSKKEATRKNTRFLKSGKHDVKFYKNIWKNLTAGQVWKGKLTNKRKDGTLFKAKATISPIKSSKGNIINYVSVMSDITNEERLEKQLLQSQKLEAIGTLAGGIAHDFNNILAIIIGYTEMAIHKPDKKMNKYYMEQILNAGDQAKDLVMQILTFSRPAEGKEKPLKITPIIKETIKLISPTLPSNIKIRSVLKSKSDIIIGDPSQVNQLLMNLYKNSIQAMKERGGTLEINLSEIEMDSYSISENPELRQGRYLKITVSDTGHGMTPEIIDRVFDPFFTTKEHGEGTGLGLSIVHGLIKSLRGAINVYSEPWLGTTFQILLPLADSDLSAEKDTLLPIPNGNSNILYVDDEKRLVKLTKDMLESIGHKVTACICAIDALEIFKKGPKDFDLLITDQTMPGMVGTELARKILEINRDIPILLCTGFSDLLTPDLINTIGIKKLLMKPVSFRIFAETINELTLSK